MPSDGPMATFPPPRALDFAATATLLRETTAQQTLFFVGGYPKSGTTWLQLLLDAHPDVSCQGEGHLAFDFTSLLHEAVSRQNQTIQSKNASVMRGIAAYPVFSSEQADFLAAAAIVLSLREPEKARGAIAIGEKTPENQLCFPQLAAWFPNAQMLHLVRDGRDCLVSAWFHNLRQDSEKTVGTYGSFADFIVPFAEDWAKRTDAASNWCRANPQDSVQIKYEDLVAHPRQALRLCFDALGVSSDDAVLDHCIQVASFERRTGGRPPGQEDRTSFFRYGKPGNWREHLTDADNRRFIEKAGFAMRRLGYF